MAAILENKRDLVATACARHGVKRLDVFGSAVRGDFRPGESDLDLLVEFQQMDPFALADAYFGLLEELRLTFDQKIDLVMADALKNRYIAAEVKRTRQTLYAA